MLEVQNVTLGYGSRPVVAGVSLTLSGGEVLAIAGANGAGKSTLMRAMNGALVPVSGNIFLDGVQLGDLSRRTISRSIAAVAQEADLRFPVTVLEFVLGGRYAWASTSAWGWETSADIAIAENVLRETQLEQFAARLMTELSGGERQRAVLARALATEAKILLLDEPTANLDLGHQAAVLALVRQRCAKAEAAAVVVMHDLNLAAEFAHHILLLKHGSPIAFGAPADVLTEALIREVFGVGVLIDAHPLTGVPRVTPVHELPAV
jgi:ABC-type cobalamin/Fe3+-siderophores transport system ATPase subunit